MNREVEFLFDYGSPFSYLANLQIEGFAKRNGAAVTYTPILLGAVLKATGNASPMTIPAKGRYMATELRRWAARYGVAFKLNPHGFMSNTLRLRGAVAAQANGWFALYHRAIYRAPTFSNTSRSTVSSPRFCASAHVPPAKATAHARLITRDELKRLEQEAIINALKQTNWKVSGPSGAAQLLGMKPSTLAARISSLGINRRTLG